jgi:BirA family biotin operon repressor/biotin-[acetyl-CoA-carboxylase] ligase
MTETLELSVAGVQKLVDGLAGAFIPAVLQETTSTNRVLLADLDAPHGAVLAAEGQREGRGRGDRVWYGTPGKDLLFSCLLLPDAPLVRLPALTLAAGLAAFDLAVDSGARTVELKWPNDVLLNGKKACGILCKR